MIPGALRVRSFRYQWPADLLTSWAAEMDKALEASAVGLQRAAKAAEDLARARQAFQKYAELLDAVLLKAIEAAKEE